MKFTPLQHFVAAHYAGGEFSEETNTNNLTQCGDTLFMFCIREAGDASDVDELYKMLTTAIGELISLREALP